MIQGTGSIIIIPFYTYCIDYACVFEIEHFTIKQNSNDFCSKHMNIICKYLFIYYILQSQSVFENSVPPSARPTLWERTSGRKQFSNTFQGDCYVKRLHRMYLCIQILQLNLVKFQPDSSRYTKGLPRIFYEIPRQALLS